MLGAGEHERPLDPPIGQQVLQEGGLSIALHVVHRLLDERRGRDHGIDRHFDGIVEERVGEARDHRRHRRREQQRLPLLGNQRRNLADRGDETHVEHPVGLVEDEDPHGAEGHEPLLEEIEQAPGGGDEDVDSRAERCTWRCWLTPPKITVWVMPAWRP